MNENSAIERAISTLANTMRLYTESYVRFGGLFRVDHEEAINNLDRAFEAKLEAFHTLYDVSKALFPYFDHGDTAVLIALRNALHHRDHPLFRSLFSRLFLEDGPARWRGASFLLATHPTLNGAPMNLSHYFRLDDFYARLDPSAASPHLDAFLRPDKAKQRFVLIERELALRTIKEKGVSERYPEDQIYLDLLPIFTSAVCRVFKVMQSFGVAFKGYDADAYLHHFTSDIEVDLSNPVFATSRIGA